MIFIPILGVPKQPPKYSSLLRANQYPQNMRLFTDEVRNWLITHEPNLKPLTKKIDLVFRFHFPEEKDLNLPDMTALLVDSLKGILFEKHSQIQAIKSKLVFDGDVGISVFYSEAK